MLSRMAAAVIGAGVLASGLAAPAEKPRREDIVYTALRPAGWDIYQFTAEDGKSRRLTTHPGLDYNPAVSPDGRWVVFCSERRGTPDLYVLDLKNGGSPRLLLGTPAMEDAPAFSPDGKRLAFVSTRSGTADICRMPFRPNSPEKGAEKVVSLTENSAGDFNPAFSPDGEWIAFSSDRDTYRESEIYVMKPDGSQQKRLTRADGWDGSPAWAKDSGTVYFYSDRDGSARLYRIGRDGSSPQALTAKGLSPEVTPDGRILYSRQHDGRWQIASVAADGSGRRAESSGSRDYWAPVANPQNGEIICHGRHRSDEETSFASRTPGPFLAGGHRVELPDRTVRVSAIRGYFPAVNSQRKQIASDEGFHRITISRLDGSRMRRVFQPDAGGAWRPTWSKQEDWLACSVGPTFAQPKTNVDIWKFRPDGSEASNLTADSSANDAFPHFSPDGSRIVFRSGRNGNHDLFVMSADGTNVRQLTEHEATDTMPAFSPTGEAVAFTSERTGDYEVYVLQLTEDGGPGKLRRITHSPGRDTHPKFSPDGKWLVIASARGGMNDEEPLIPVFNPQPYGEIFAVRLADGKVVRLSHNKWEDGTPGWGRLR